MKLRQLEIVLESLNGFPNPSARLEQYRTPAPLAARFIHTAMMNGDIAGSSVLDLGSGTGILSIAASLLGAVEVTGIETDPDAIRVAEENAKKTGCTITFIQADLRRSEEWRRIPSAGTVIMNPPFGAQNEHADRPFIDCALERGEIVYGIFNAGTRRFLGPYIIGRGEISDTISAGCTIPRTFSFHADDRREIPVEIYRIRKTRPKTSRQEKR